MTRVRRAGLFFVATASLLTCGALVARAQSVENFYKGKTIQVMIGYGPGGTDDTWARLIAKYLTDRVPGHPSAIGVNVPGAGSLLLANQVYNTQPKDGTVIGLINRGVPFEPLFSGMGDRFDPLKFNYLGSPDVDTLVCEARKDAAVQSLEDLKTKELIVGSTGSGADSQIYPEVLTRLLGLKFKIVQGYPGSSDILLALERGEVQGICVSYDTIARSPYFAAGKSRILLQAALQPDPRIDAPLVTSVATSPEDAQALRLILERTRVGRPFVMAPGVPKDRVDALRSAFESIVRDPAFIAEAKQANLTPRLVTGEDIANSVREAAAFPADIVAVAKKAFGR